MYYLFLTAMVLLGTFTQVRAQISFAAYEDVQVSLEDSRVPELRVLVSPIPIVDRVNLALLPAPAPQQVLKLLLRDEKGQKVIQLAGTLKNLTVMLQRVTYKLASGAYELGISTGGDFAFVPYLID